MPEHPHLDPSDPTDASLLARLDALDTAIGDVAARLARLRRTLAGEVRTRRLVVAEADGFERVVADATGGVGAVTVRTRTHGPGTVGVEVFAADPVGDDPAHVGVALLDGGDVVAAVDLASGRPAMVWLAGEDEPLSPRPGAGPGPA